MAYIIADYGLESFVSDYESANAFFSYVIDEGKQYTGYYENPCFFKTLGNAEIIIKAETNENGHLNIIGVDTHCGGSKVWEMLCTGLEVTAKDRLPLGRSLIVCHKDGKGGLLPIEIINADVLPSFLEGEVIKAQVVAEPISISYYENEEEYAANQPTDKNGDKILLDDGVFFPGRFFGNHNPQSYDRNKDYRDDTVVLFKAKVNGLNYGITDVAGQEMKSFIRCYAETQHGEIEFDHTIDQVPEAQRKYIKAGSIISGECILSGDSMIYEYEKGVVKDFDHDLSLLRYTFVKGEAERMRGVLSPSAVYESAGRTFTGADEIIERLNDVYEHKEKEYYAHFATVIEAENTEYSIGTRCLVLAAGNESSYESIAFLTVNNEGLIDKIKICRDNRYRFEVDPPVYVLPPSK